MYSWKKIDRLEISFERNSGEDVKAVYSLIDDNNSPNGDLVFVQHKLKRGSNISVTPTSGTNFNSLKFLKMRNKTIHSATAAEIDASVTPTETIPFKLRKPKQRKLIKHEMTKTAANKCRLWFRRKQEEDGLSNVLLNSNRRKLKYWGLGDELQELIEKRDTVKSMKKKAMKSAKTPAKKVMKKATNTPSTGVPNSTSPKSTAPMSLLPNNVRRALDFTDWDDMDTPALRKMIENKEISSRDQLPLRSDFSETPRYTLGNTVREPFE